jgi:hypothetical protein
VRLSCGDDVSAEAEDVARPAKESSLADLGTLLGVIMDTLQQEEPAFKKKRGPAGRYSQVVAHGASLGCTVKQPEAAEAGRLGCFCSASRG